MSQEKGKSGRRTAAWISFALLAGICLGSYDTASTATSLAVAEPLPPAVETPKIDCEWRPRALPLVNVQVQRPPVPQLPPVEKVLLKNGAVMHSLTSLGPRLHVLLEQHPVEEIRREFGPLVVSGKLLVDYQASPKSYAEIRLFPASVKTRAGKRLGESGLVPVLMVNPSWLGGLQTEQQILSAQLVLLHEYQHYKESQLGNVPTAASSEADRCRHTWQAESSAYAVQCRTANQWGKFDFLGDLCAFVDTPQWSQIMLLHMRNNNSRQMQERCLQDWATLAGHPSPTCF